MKIAIIGTGISGLGTAYLLNDHHDIIVYEKNGYIGGHTRTIDAPTGSQTTPVDTGFIVFNDWNYPNLMGLFKTLGVTYHKSDMSFGVSINNGWLEYSSSAMFAQFKNIFRSAYWKMLFDIIRFNKQAPKYLNPDHDISLEDCLSEMNMGAWFRQYYLLAMGAAIWSCPVQTIMKFPARTFIHFFRNHGLLNLIKRPQWYTVTDGSREYIPRLTERFSDKIKLNCGVQRVISEGGKVTVEDEKGHTEIFDHVVFACHADQALSMIKDPDNDLKNIIGAFDYQKNTIITHNDPSFMPKQKKCWASWVYLSDGQKDKRSAVALTYWMNNLQGQDPAYPLFVTLNPDRRPKEKTIIDEHVFSHPVFDQKAINAQKKIKDIQGKNGLWFCGAYQRYGFHEDGLLSAVNVAKAMGISIPWA